MPTRPPRICPKCRRTVPSGQRCQCTPKPDNRPTATARGYDRAWHRIRDAFLAAHPTCAVCGAVAVDVDHIVARRAGGSDDWANLQALCARHHRSTKQAQERRGGRVRGCDANGWPLDPAHPWNREARHAGS